MLFIRALLDLFVSRAAARETPKPEPAPQIPEVVDVEEEKAVEAKTYLFISAGHSDTDPGASATHDGRLWTEADIVLELRNLVVKELCQLGIPTATDGDSTTNLPLVQAIKEAKKYPIAVEFHCNAFTTPTATGCETLASNKHTSLCLEICDTIATTLGIHNRGPKTEASGQHSRLGFISQADGIIVELFFITNPNDLRLYRENKHELAKNLATLLAEQVKPLILYRETGV